MQRADRCFEASAREHLLDPPIAQGLLATGACDYPAAHGGEFERLRKMPQGAAVRSQLRFDLLSGRARAETRELTLRVQVQQPVHAAQVERQHRSLTNRAIQMTGNTGATCVRNHDPVLEMREVQ